MSGGSGDGADGYRLPPKAGSDGRCSFMDPVFIPFASRRITIATHYYRVQLAHIQFNKYQAGQWTCVHVALTSACPSIFDCPARTNTFTVVGATGLRPPCCSLAHPCRRAAGSASSCRRCGQGHGQQQDAHH